MAIDPRFPNLHILDHPLIVHKLSHMRKVTTSTRTFRELLREIAQLMGYEITRKMPITYEDIQTPICKMSAPVLSGKKSAIVPILRAGLGMADGLLGLMPSARVGHIGMYRDPETKRPVEYLRKLPTAAGRMFVLVDPMLATGYSASAVWASGGFDISSLSHHRRSAFDHSNLIPLEAAVIRGAAVLAARTLEKS